MTNRRKNKKRYRNKSSPQTVSISKKYKNSETASLSDHTIETTIEPIEPESKQSNTCCSDNESIGNFSILSEIRSVVDSNPEVESTDSLEPTFNSLEPTNQGNLIMENSESEHLQISQSILNVDAAVPPPVSHTYVNPNVLHGSQQQAINFGPHQMQHPFNMQQTPPPMLVQQNISDDDVLRIATKLQEMLSKEIDKLVEQKVALKVAPLLTEVDSLKKSLADVKKELKDVSARNDDLEQYSRRSCLRISGIPENVSEDTTQIVLDLADRCGTNIGVDDIDRSHRVGRVVSGEPQGTNKPREIIVKFRSHGARLQLLKGRAYLREKKLNIYVNEDLSKARKSLSHACRKLKKDSNSNIVNTWIYNGNVFVQDNVGNKLRVTSLEDLNPYQPSDNINGHTSI